MAAEELELKQQIVHAEVRMEEKIYEQYNEQELSNSDRITKDIDTKKNCPNVNLNRDPVDASSSTPPLNPRSHVLLFLI